LKLSMCGVPVHDSNKTSLKSRLTLHLEGLCDTSGGFGRYWTSSSKVPALCREIHEFRNNEAAYHSPYLLRRALFYVLVQHNFVCGFIRG
jgi:hypothetical protein